MTAPPQAPRQPFEHAESGTVRPDLSSIVESLRSEMMGRTPVADSSVSCLEDEDAGARVDAQPVDDDAEELRLVRAPLPRGAGQDHTGGLLIGAVLSRRPDRWRAVVAEWDEWGDPRDPEQRSWLLAYSPYDNLPPPGGRADLLVTGALHDPRSWSGSLPGGWPRSATPTRSGRRGACSGARPGPAPTRGRRGGSRGSPRRPRCAPGCWTDWR